MLSEIDNYLVEFTGHIKQQNAAGKYDINKLAENRAVGLLNLIYGYKLENANNILQNNFPAVDLVDAHNGVVIQVTATSGTDKFIYTLEKFMENKLYNTYNQLIIYILTDKQDSIYKSTVEKIQKILDGKISFDFKTNVIDNKGLGAIINGFINIKQIGSIHKFLENEFKAVKDSKIELPQDLNLFSSNTGNDFIERTSLIEEINAKFQRSNIVLLHGISGIGKTAIAKSVLGNLKSW
ncbi:hypothetical protein CLV58_114146 [Spirosoma oryzae]|uniref:SMEK domain-containing protein n=2 Tax=Spirosoma oryzae TaxID=1469603 RepID=A0A2T0SQ82_9BACT|nr:hypothetical protein CLV58_114146 [Spirosoma oryzae]